MGGLGEEVAHRAMEANETGFRTPADCAAASQADSRATGAASAGGKRCAPQRIAGTESIALPTPQLARPHADDSERATPPPPPLTHDSKSAPRVDDESRRYRSCRSRLGVTDLAATRGTTGLEELWPGSTMNRAVDAAPTLQFWISISISISGVDNRIARLPSDVAPHDLQGRIADPQSTVIPVNR